ncbi:MAM domain-containing glycosylphosphatidylinositol anchor protein 2-like [Macrobrachium rosenbergii]|uniref:MAM domain-containing glycosylphosphatidylinositol anchor protein 2-like n=1 Tax=Macrobrachium rosenbergii TaxID=79674 RepID=UPI0034D6E513
MGFFTWPTLTCMVFTWIVPHVGGFAPSIDIPETTTEPPPTTPDPETLPYFLHYLNSSRITINKGKTAVLDCQVFRLKDRTVSWVRRKGSNIHLLTVGTATYHENEKYKLEFMEPNNWQLVIHATDEGDQGSYECQISSHPPKIRKVYLTINVPRLDIHDGRGQAIQEKFYEVGSGIDLRCTGQHVPKDSIVWSRGDTRIVHAPEAGVSLETSMGEGGPVSILKVKEAAVKDSGNYTCSAPEADPATVRIQVLDGESSAAMQHSTNGAENLQIYYETIPLGLLVLVLICLP